MSTQSSNETAVWAYYRYSPSLIAATVSTVLFGLTTFVHLYQLARYRAWFFIPFVIGGFFEWVGYVGRILSSQESPNWTMGPYIQQSLLLLLAPALFAASIYMILGRMILRLDSEKLCIFKKKWLTKFFVAGDVLSFSVQAAGGGIMAGGSWDSLHLGEKIVVAGLIIQVLFFGFFIITSAIFHIRLYKSPNQQSLVLSGIWQKHMTVLYVASMLIMIRSIFRTVEYAMGNNGYLLRHECDERRPECTHCANRNTACQYASEASVTPPRSNTEESSPCSLPIHPLRASAQTHPTSIPQDQTSIPIEQVECAANLPPTSGLNIRDMELLLHWCSSTYATMAHTAEVEDVFQFLLPTDGLTYPFLLHGVLALSALHIARTENRSDGPSYFSIALEHQNCALALFRPEVLSLNCENSNIVFVFSGILYQLAFAKGPCSPYTETYDPIRDLLQGFDLCRGLREVTGLSWHWVKEGRISDVLIRVDDNKIWPLPDKLQEALSRLSHFNEYYGKDVSNHDTACYASAISSLTDLMEISQGKPRRVELALRWSFNLTDKYVDLLRGRDSMALVILAHYCLLLHRCRHQWWMEDWSLNLARSVWGLLDEHWRPSAIWALKEVGLEV
ncbi:hypothetical protein N7534_006331 [Penicillium rubens]|nr:hypothetical protein N7534_006331 [Penicillium rubens]